MGRLFVFVAAMATFYCLPLAAEATESVLVEFGSARCQPCQRMKPIIESLGRSGVAVRTVDVDQEPDLARRYGIQQTPTFIVISGGKELTRLVGAQSSEQLLAALSIDPAGPWVDTASKPLDTLPQTRLAPLPTSMVPPSPRSLQPEAISEPMPSVAVADAIQRAQAATVRLRVHDGPGYGAGTGTIIDSHGEEALVMTCGHLFRDTKGQGRIEVDLFVGGETRTVEGQLIDYDADDRDIALVAIRPGFAIQPVRLAGPTELPTVGDIAFSFGCDRGADPSRRDTRITGVNKYNQEKGASNLEIAGAPIDGRSGGGLFDRQGNLIGVCNAADYEGEIGIYAGPGSIRWQIDRVQLARLYESAPVSNSAIVAATADNAGPTSIANAAFANSSPESILPQPTAAPSDWPNAPPERFASLAGAIGGSSSPASDTEVIVIVRNQKDPAASARIMTLARPSAELMHMIESQAAR